MPLAVNWERTTTALQECCDVAAAYGVSIGIQNHHDVAVHSRALLGFLHDFNRPNCKRMFDAWSLALINDRSIIPYLVMSETSGEGFVANADFLQGLRDGGFEGSVAYEMCSPLSGGGDTDNLDA